MQKFYYFCTVEYFGLISSKLNIAVKQVAATVALLNENATIPFIARYRKEATGELNDEILRTFDDRRTIHLRRTQV